MQIFKKTGFYELFPFEKNGKWVFEFEGKTFDLAPADIINVVLSPLIIGVDRLIVLGCKAKKIENFQSGFTLLFSEEFLPNADVKLVYKEACLNGWVYEIEELNLRGIMPGQKAWICAQMGIFFREIPKQLFLKLEPKGAV